MIDMQARSATVRALAPSRLLRITSEDMDALYRVRSQVLHAHRAQHRAGPVAASARDRRDPRRLHGQRARRVRRGKAPVARFDAGARAFSRLRLQRRRRAVASIGLGVADVGSPALLPSSGPASVAPVSGVAGVTGVRDAGVDGGQNRARVSEAIARRRRIVSAAQPETATGPRVGSRRAAGSGTASGKAGAGRQRLRTQSTRLHPKRDRKDQPLASSRHRSPSASPGGAQSLASQPPSSWAASRIRRGGRLRPRTHPRPRNPVPASSRRRCPRPRRRFRRSLRSRRPPRRPEGRCRACPRSHLPRWIPNSTRTSRTPHSQGYRRHSPSRMWYRRCRSDSREEEAGD